jgi:hypothetical protein
MQQPAQPGRLPLGRHLAKAIDPAIQTAAHPNRSVTNLSCHCPIKGRHWLALEFPIKG